MSATNLPSTSPRPGRRRLVILPLIVFFGLAGLFLLRLGAGDPSRLPSALIGHAIPAFSLPGLPGRGDGQTTGLGDADLRAGHVTIVNVFASWCPECHEEHDQLIGLAKDPVLTQAGVTLAGIVYKDKPEDARRYLGRKGDPYRLVGQDLSGRAGIDFGVYGVPETFVIKGDGTIAYKLIGPVTETNLPVLMAEIDKAGK